MSQITTYKCDRCKLDSTNWKDLDLKEIRIGMKKVSGSYSSSSYALHDFSNRKAEWCEACCREVGIIPPLFYGKTPQDETVQQPKPTLEDLIREIVQEEIS